MDIYDYEKAYEIINETFKMHMSIDMNGQKIKGLPNLQINTTQPLSYLRIGSCLSCRYRVMDARGRLLSTREA